jgi:hypothetical protein
MGVGLIILVSYLVNNPVFCALRLVFIDWAVILAGLAVVAGGLNLLLVLARRVDQMALDWPYSLLTAIAAIVTFGVGLMEGVKTGGATLYQSTSFSNVLFEGIIVTSQAALASLVMFALVAAAVQMARSKPNNWTLAFLGVVIISLVGWLPFGALGILNRLRDWLISVPASAGARGILIGVVLGTLGIGLRILTGLERPYRD